MGSRLGLPLAALAILGCGGCDGIVVEGGNPPASNEITVRVFNNTDFEVDPAVEFGFSENTLRSLNIGIVDPGEVVEVDIDCDDAIVLTTTESAQLGFSMDFVLDPLPIFEIDVDYFCGELVEFEFVGDGLEFDVFVDAGGENIF